MEISSVMLTMLHRDFKKLYRVSCERGNESVRSLLDECAVYNDTSHQNVLHLLWDGTWKNGGTGERFIEDYVEPLSHHIGYVCDDLTIYDRENKIFDERSKPNSRILNSCVFETDIPIIVPSFYVSKAYTQLHIDRGIPISAGFAYEEPVFVYKRE